MAYRNEPGLSSETLRFVARKSTRQCLGNCLVIQLKEVRQCSDSKNQTDVLFVDSVSHCHPEFECLLDTDRSALLCPISKSSTQVRLCRSEEFSPDPYHNSVNHYPRSFNYQRCRYSFAHIQNSTRTIKFGSLPPPQARPH